MKDFLNMTEVKNLLEYKSILLYLLIIGYSVKYFLNDEKDVKMYNPGLQNILKNFNELFSYWKNKYFDNKLIITPKIMNLLYIKYN